MTKGRKDDAGKLRWHLVPWEPMREVVSVLMHGADKYGEFNWQGVNPRRYENAAYRHLIAWSQGEENDLESKRSHLAHAVCSLLFLMWLNTQR